MERLDGVRAPGPRLVRVSALWRDPGRDDGDPAAFCDGVTVYPDHIAGHGAAVAVLAAVIGRARSGRGAALGIAQADVAVMHLGPALAAQSVLPGAVAPVGNVFPGHVPAGSSGARATTSGACSPSR